jgi:hypothetical protein
MKYLREQLKIELISGPAKWYWYIMADNEAVSYGSSGMYEDASDQALLAFDGLIYGTRPGV